MCSLTVAHGDLLFQELGIEASINFGLMRWVSIGLERSDQSAQTRREHNQITSIGSSAISVSHAGRYEHRHSRTDGLCPVTVAKNKFTLQDMPRFVVGVVDMEHGRATAAPLMNLK